MKKDTAHGNIYAHELTLIQTLQVLSLVSELNIKECSIAVADLFLTQKK